MGKVLVVDDEPSIRNLLRFTLEVEGFEVDTASGGKEALQKMSQKQPNVVDGCSIRFIGRQSRRAWPQTAMNVILQARMGVLSVQIYLAGRDLEVTMNEMNQAMS